MGHPALNALRRLSETLQPYSDDEVPVVGSDEVQIQVEDELVPCEVDIDDLPSRGTTTRD